MAGSTIDGRGGSATPPTTSSASSGGSAASGGAPADASKIKDALFDASKAHTWGTAFWNAVESARVVPAVAGQGSVVGGAHNDIFAGLSTSERQSANDALFNAVKDLPKGSEAWSALWSAGITPNQASGDSAHLVYGTGSSAAGTAAASPGGASAQGAGTTSAQGGGGPAAQGAGISSAQTTGGTSAQGASGSAAQGTSAASAVSGPGPEDAGYTREELKRDLTTVLQEHPSKLRPDSEANKADWKDTLGGPDRLKLWTDDKVDELYKGIQTAKQFFPNMSTRDLGHMILAEGAQESTGDYTSNVHSGNPGAGLGFLQVTQDSVVKDYNTFGTPVKAPDGSTVLSPSPKTPPLDQLRKGNDPSRTKPEWMDMGSFDPANVTQNVAMWAWRASNSAAVGIDPDSHLHWGQGTQGPNTFGDAQAKWVGSPRDKSTYGSHYNTRMRDYYSQAKFGSIADFDRLQQTPMGTTTRNMRSADEFKGFNS